MENRVIHNNEMQMKVPGKAEGKREREEKKFHFYFNLSHSVRSGRVAMETDGRVSSVMVEDTVSLTREREGRDEIGKIPSSVN